MSAEMTAAELIPRPCDPIEPPTLPLPQHRTWFDQLRTAAERPTLDRVVRLAVVADSAPGELASALTFLIEESKFELPHRLYRDLCAVFHLLAQEVVVRPAWSQVARLLLWADHAKVDRHCRAALCYLIQQAGFVPPLLVWWQEAEALRWDLEVVLVLGYQLDQLLADTVWQRAQDVLGRVDAPQLVQLIRVAELRQEQARPPKLYRRLETVIKLLRLSQRRLLSGGVP